MQKRRPGRQTRQTTPRTAPRPASSTPIQLDITGYSIEGRGIARRDGKTVFVRDALPGEQVLAQLEKEHSRYDEAALLDCLSPSPARIAPACPHYAECGGCDLQHLAPDQQLVLKEAAILDQLARFAATRPDQVTAPISSPQSGYRRSARIGINQLQRDGRLIIGFRRRNSHKLTPIEHCLVLDPRLAQLFSTLHEVLTPFSDLKHLTHLDLSLGDTSGALCCRVTRQPEPALVTALMQAAERLSLQLYFEFNERQIQAVGDARELSYHLPAENICLHFQPGDFLQVNSQVNREMVAQAISWLAPTPDDRVLDLFCGLGNFTLALARHAAEVQGVEGSIRMVERAQHNATINGCDNVRFHCADLSQPCSQLPWMRQPHDLILLDPPRSGAAELVKSLGRTGARRILYIACSPAALVRDTAALVSQGYRMTRFNVLDMFPQTSHIESMALFEKGR